MKQILFMLALLAGVSTSHAQYDRDKLMGILTGGSTKTWTVKSATTERAEKSFTFSKDMSAAIEKAGGKGTAAAGQAKWALATKDNIRWFVTIGSERFELIVSYAKDGSQYLKLAKQDGTEMNLYPAK